MRLSLPFYILHQTVLVTVGYFVLPWGIPEVLEWAAHRCDLVRLHHGLIYEYLIRRWNVMRFLFGMKRLPPRIAEGAVQASAGWSCQSWLAAD